MSDMVKYRAAIWSFFKAYLPVFYHVWHSPLNHHVAECDLPEIILFTFLDTFVILSELLKYAKDS